MSEAEQTTLDSIHSAAMQEFLEKGFRTASLQEHCQDGGCDYGSLLMAIIAVGRVIRVIGRRAVSYFFE